MPRQKKGLNVLLRKLETMIGWIAKLLCYGATALFLFLMLIIIIDVFCRTFLSFSIVGTPAFARNALIGITFLALPQVTWLKKHVRSELVVDNARGLLGRILNLAASAAGLVTFFLLTWSLYRPTLQALRLGETDKEGMTFIPLSPFYIICLIGGAISLVGVARALLRTAAGKDEDSGEQKLTGQEI